MFEQVNSTCDHKELENRILAWWGENRAFEKLRAKNAGKEPWSFLDGPITANNPMGVHHAWGRTLKDCYQRYHAMLGHDQRYQNGFDCQGLWVEVEVEKQMGYETKADIERAGLEKFIKHCKERVEKYSKIQTEQSVRLGYWMDWENSYYTMSDENNYTIWAFLKKCHERGLIYKGLDAMPWCPRCETGISEQERREGYKNVEDTAVFVRLPLKERAGEYLLVWTTTPWTLAANVAAAVNPELTYVKARQGESVYYLAENLVGILKEKGEHTVEGKLPGKELIGWRYNGPFDDLEIVQSTFAEAGYEHRVIEWAEVSDSDGTGIVHIAPGCGKEDFDLGKELGLPILMPIDETGIYTGGYGFLTGQKASQVAEGVIEDLRQKEVYYKKERYAHDYPHCWRCHEPLLFRSVDEWYIDMSWRKEIMQVVEQIKWIPSWGREQELNWLENMHDWMISKKRFWGLALPIFECECGWFDVIGGREELEKRTVEGWEKFEGQSPHRPWVDALRIKCEKCGGLAKRIPDVGNPWLDAGIVPYSTVKYNTDREYWEKWIPADLVLECFPGQFRNWFYALLAMSTMMENKAPFKTLLGHALVRDEHGKEMHKSTGNAIWFEEAADRMGADVMRWIYCGHNPTNNLNFGYTVGEQVQRRVFSTWWNVYSFFVNYARLDGFDPKREAVAYEDLQDIDRWILSKLQVLAKVANESLGSYDTNAFIQQADDFVERLSNWYVRRNRRRYWRPKSDSDTDKLAAYQTLYRVLVDLAKLLAPVCPFVTEEMYQNLVRSHDGEAAESVHHCDYPQCEEELLNEKLAWEMDLVADTVSRVLSIRETRQIRVRQPLSRLIIASGDEATREALGRFEAHLLDELNIKKLEFAGNLDTYVSYSLKPNHKAMGPKFGKDMKLIAGALEEADASEVAKAVSAGQEFSVGAGDKTWELAAEDVVVETDFAETLAVSEAVEPALVLDIELTEELQREGFARDVVRHIQQIRKDIGLEIQNHIAVRFKAEADGLRAALEEYHDYIKSETLCDDLGPAADGELEAAKEIKIAGELMQLVVRKTDF
ncbi:MAG: isoleucine--tRNA ligase [Sedimentisphaerales bacterium]|nr:isoleucine--tRNA ligase [Sedimentisphaerales bacterium]